MNRRWVGNAAWPVAVFLIAASIWVGCSLSWIKQRHEALRVAGAADTDLARYFFLESSGTAVLQPTAPGMLWLFGEPGWSHVPFDANSSTTREELKRLFPEAEVIDLLAGETEPPC